MMTTEMLLAGMGTLLLAIGAYIAACLKELTKSVQELNVKMAVVISTMKGHDERIRRLEEKE